jgi:hypothetical protein
VEPYLHFHVFMAWYLIEQQEVNRYCFETSLLDFIFLVFLSFFSFLSYFSSFSVTALSQQATLARPVFGRCTFRTSAGTPAPLTDNFRGFSQSLQENAEIAP